MNIIKKLGTPNQVNGRKGFVPKAVVLHITDSSFDSAMNTFFNPSDEKSAHYLINSLGDIYKLVEETDTAWHAGKTILSTWKGIEKDNPNLYTVGIEVALKANEFPTWSQWVETAKLVKDICVRWNIPQNELGIVNHNEINGAKVCPGKWITRFWVIMLNKVII